MDHLLRVVEGIAGSTNLWGELNLFFHKNETGLFDQL